MRRRMTRTCLLLAGALAGGGAPVSPRAAPARPPAAVDAAGGRPSQLSAAPPPAVEPALRAAMDALRIRTLAPVHDAGLVSLKGTTADDRRVAITLEPAPDATR